MWLMVTLVLATLAVALGLYYPFRVCLHARLEAEHDGRWAGEGAIEMAGVSLSVVGASRLGPILEAHLLGLRVLRRTLNAPESLARVAREGAGRALGFGRRFGEPYALLVELVELVGARRRFHETEIDASIGYSLANVGLTGRIAGALAVLSALLPPGVRLEHQPRWEPVDRVSARVDGKLRMTAGLFLIDTLVFFVKAQARERRVRARQRARAVLDAGGA